MTASNAQTRVRDAAVALLAALGLLAASGCGGGGTSTSGVLVVVRNEGLVQLSLDGGLEQQLVAALPDSRLVEPALSPAGDRLAFVRLLTPVVVPGEPVELGMDLYLADADGRNPAVLIEHSRPNEQVRAPAWFPDGQRLLINVQNLEGAQIVSAIETLSLETGARSVVVDDAFHPAISPDGARIVFLRQDEQLNQSLWLANADGSDERLLAGARDGIGFISSPRFSPDGRFVAFAASELQGGAVARPGGPYAGAPAIRSLAARPAANGLPQDIWLYDLDAGELHTLAALQLDQPSIAWSGDGATIFAFGGAGLYGVDAGDGEFERLAEGTFHGQIDWVAAE